MKQLFLLSITFLLCSFAPKEAHQPMLLYPKGITAPMQSDKAFLLDYYHKTATALEKSVEGLTTAQLQFQPSASAWSISQCLAHIILTEKMLFDLAKETLEKPATPERKGEVVVTDQQVIDAITDRTYKAEAPAELEGKGIYTSAATAMSDLHTQRSEILAFIRNASVEDLRDHISDSPFGPVDAYHSLLYIAGHTARHTLQIEEVKAKDGFPTQ